MATDIMVTSTTELTHPICVARFTRFSHPSLKMRSFRSAQNRDVIARTGDPIALSIISWSFATIGFRSVELFDAIAEQHERFVEKGDEKVRERASERSE